MFVIGGTNPLHMSLCLNYSWQLVWHSGQVMLSYMASYNLSESTIFLVCPNENVTNTCVFKETAHRVSFLHVYKCGFISWCYKVDRWVVCWRVLTPPPPHPRKVVYVLREWCANCHTVTLTLQNNFRIAQYLWTTTVYSVQFTFTF